MSGFKNKQRAIRRMRAIGPAVRRGARIQMEKNAIELVETQKSFAPVDEGELRDSIRQFDTSNAERISRRVIADAKDEKGRPIANWVEHGTSRSVARPFFWPAYRLLRRRFKTRMTRQARKDIGEAIKK